MDYHRQTDSKRPGFHATLHMGADAPKHCVHGRSGSAVAPFYGENYPVYPQEVKPYLTEIKNKEKEVIHKPY